MKQFGIALLICGLLGCSGGETATSTNETPKPSPTMKTLGKEPNSTTIKPTVNKPKEALTFDDDVFAIPPYPEATIEPNTSTERTEGNSHTYNRTYRSNDEPDKVELYYKSEGPKHGEAQEMSSSPSGGPKFLVYKMKDGRLLQVQISSGLNKKGTFISLAMVQPKS